MRCACGSYAINHHCHGRDGSDGDKCDVCYWRSRAERYAELISALTHPAITHCDNCGFDWLDNGLNPAACPYCKQPAADKIAAAFRYERNGIVGYVDAPIHSINMHDDGIVEVVIDYWPEQLSDGDATRWIKENGNG